MMRLLMLTAGVLLALPCFAQTAFDGCARSRDPVRCEARLAALKNCADLRGTAKGACLEAGIPPVDCGKTANPQKCAAVERAKEVCKKKTGKELRKCLRNEQPQQQKKPRKPRPAA